MTSKHKFSILSILIIIAMLCSLFVLPVSAVAEAETLALKKIDTALAKKLETMNDADIVSVSVLDRVGSGNSATIIDYAIAFSIQ